MNYPLIELHYLPSVRYLSLMLRYGGVCLEAHEHYQKQSYRNRAMILGPHKPERLTIPIKHSAQPVPIRQAEMDFRTAWPKQHWRTIRTAYGKAPFFGDYAEPLKARMLHPPQSLFEFNRQLLSLCLQAFQLELTVCLSDSYQPMMPRRPMDFREQIHPKIQTSAEDRVSYWQVFGNVFVPELSVLDLLFSEGPYGRSVLEAQAARLGGTTTPDRSSGQ